MLLYIHIPFCDSKCHYCAFNSYTSLHHLQDKFTEALCKQLIFELNANKDKKITTIFIGGGTPSTIGIKHYHQIFQILNPYLSTVEEITIEANPNSANEKWLSGIFDLGINRISFGVQSFNDKKLDFLGRNHNSSMAIKAIENAYKIGFKHINCDIIYDTILDTKKLLDNDLKIIKDLPIDHISAYSLTLEDGTNFFDKSDVKVDDEDMARYIFDQLRLLGFEQYEISNFAKNKQSQSKHNLGYWEYEEYIGAGAGAVGCINKRRLYTHQDINKYIKSPTTYENIERLSNDDIKTEKVLLGFRCIIGIDENILNINEQKKMEELKELGKVNFNNNRYYANDFLLADELALYVL
jgi:oxygen-independent coproporphyrinogen-3 oxidase